MTEKNENGAVGRFALEEEYSSSVAEVLKAAWDWIESSEMECGPGPLRGSLEATATATPLTPCTFQGLSTASSPQPQKEPRWKGREVEIGVEAQVTPMEGPCMDFGSDSV